VKFLSPVDSVNEPLGSASLQAGLAATAGGGESTKNTYREDWMLLVQNPWIEPAAFAFITDTEERNSPRDYFVERSRTALREWMDENPYS